jgi:polynucleotide 5'-kinase involved in rRNA processing
MLRKEGEHERSYHSEDKKRSMSREEHRQLKMEKMKLKFRNISNRIKEIKKDNSTDITQLTTLLRSSDEIEKMANQSLQKAKLILSESKLNKKSASPAFHEVRHLRNTATADFSTQPANE